MSRLHLVIATLVATSLYVDSAAPVPQTANEFCKTYEDTCSDTKFADTAACKEFYGGAIEGTLGDPIDQTAAGATRACYQYHLSAASEDNAARAKHCPHAKGTTFCVAPVPQTANEFCTAYEGTCKDIGNKFADIPACEKFFNGAAKGTLGNPIADTDAGPTQACYQYHLSAAISTDAATHCPHARGTTTCTGPPAPQTADEFCTAYEGVCRFQPSPKRFAAGIPEASCKYFYEQADPGTLEDPIDQTADGATRSCYQHHLSVALVAPPEKIDGACVNARGVPSTSVCVAPKECTPPKVFNAKKTACVLVKCTPPAVINAAKNGCDEPKCTGGTCIDPEFSGAPMRATPLAALVATAAAMFAL